MTGSVALDVVIGLVFVYTLYSLLTTTLTEFIATWVRFRSFFLIRGIERMLDDDSGTKVFSEIFMSQPLIKYLTSGSAIFFKAPAYMSAPNFSKNLLETLKVAYSLKAMKEIIALMNGANASKNITDVKSLITRLTKDVQRNKQADALDIQAIRDVLKAPPQELLQERDRIETILINIEAHDDMRPLDKIRQVLDSKKNYVGRSETVKHLRSLLDDSNDDLEKFKAYVEQWYDDTMERVSGWYKKWTQVITFFVGFLIAGFFNADTILIADKLSNDPTMRNQMIQMASAYIEAHPNPPVSDQSAEAVASRKKLDSLMTVTKDIKNDVESANSTLGLGWSFPERIQLLDPKSGALARYKGKVPDDKYFKVERFNGGIAYIELGPVVTDRTLHHLLKHEDSEDRFCLTEAEKETGFVYVSKSHFFWASFFGYFLTAVALSLGAPFWFDLLNKLMKLRTAVKAPPSESSAQSNVANDNVPVTKRVG